MPVVHTLQKCVEDPAPDTIIRIGMNPDSACNLIRSLKPDSRYMISQLIRILFDHPIHTLPIMLIDLRSQSCRYPILLQIQHSLAHIPLLFHLCGYLSGLTLADPLDLSQPLRFFLNDPKGILLKLLNDLPRKSHADPLDRPRAKISLN